MCTRAVYLGEGKTILTGRSMDWSEQMDSNFYLFPRGMTKMGGNGENVLKWTSKYGSVVTSIYEGGTADGMNENGLVVNMLFFAESEYPDSLTSEKPVIYISAWAQYVLDNYQTVSKAVNDLQKESFIVKVSTAPNGIPGKVHLSLSDSSGDSAILEYIDGKLVVHHGKQYQVMTNEPVYEEQLAIAKYWKQIGSVNLLPGTNRASDRYVRADYYINASRQTNDPKEALAVLASIIRNISVPRGLNDPLKPNISTTIWRTYSDNTNKIYYFEDTAHLFGVWVELKKLDFSAGNKVKKIQLEGNVHIFGDITDDFTEVSPFSFISE